MKGRIIVDVAEDDGALIQVIYIANKAQTSSVEVGYDKQVQMFGHYLKEIIAQTGLSGKIIQFPQE